MAATRAQSRRDFLKQTCNAGLALATPLLGSAWLTSAPLPDEKVDKRVRVGILHSLTGFLGMSESTLRDAELLAIDEINKAGGVFGKQIDPIVEDPESKFTDFFPEKAKKLLVKDEVVAVFGCWVSVARKNVLPIFEENNALLFYPVAYEGSECSKNVVYTGSLPNQQVLPAIDYLWDKLGKRKFYLIGSDYVYPRVVNYIVTEYLKKKYKADPVATTYVTLGHQEFEKSVADIVKAGPDVILNTIWGDSLVPFFDQFAKQGPGPDKMPVCLVQATEDDLRGLDPARVNGHLVASSYFQSVDSPKNKQFVSSFKKAYGKERVTNDAIEAAYFQVYLWKLAVEKAKSFQPDKVREALRGLEFEAPCGKVKVDEKNQHTWKPFRLGKIKDGQMEIIHTSSEAIAPDPYPQVAFPGWSCDWTKDGVTRGEAIKIR
jgi:urea transport system substrate-binding protein